LAPIETSVPQAVVAPLRRALGIDVSGIPVRRGDAVTSVANRLGARGFTTDGVVHIPDHVGALDGRDASPLLAHELTHAVQQQRFGAALPAPGSAHGRRLEDDAVAVEQWFGTGAVGTPPQLAAAEPGWEGAHDLPVVDAGELVRAFETETGTRFTPTAEDQRTTDVSTGGLLAAYRDLRRLTAEEGEPPETAEPGDNPAPPSTEELMDLIADNPPRRWLDLDDPDNFEEIANRLYNHLLGRLRFDVLVERERSGTLLDFS
jgi:hypothetical protein